MLHVLIYDLDQGHGQVKEEAFKLGFFNVIGTERGRRVAPRTTLFRRRGSTADALAAFDQAVARASATLGRPIVVDRVFAARAEDWWILSELPTQQIAGPQSAKDPPPVP